MCVCGLLGFFCSKTEQSTVYLPTVCVALQQGVMSCLSSLHMGVKVFTVPLCPFDRSIQTQLITFDDLQTPLEHRNVMLCMIK